MEQKWKNEQETSDNMTNLKAIKILKKLYERTDITDDLGEMVDMKPYEEAVDMAIKALEGEPFMNKPCVANQVCHEDKVKMLDKIRTEIEQYIDKEKLSFGGQFDSGLNFALKIIDKYKAESEGKI